MREAVNEDTSDRRKTESAWKVHRLHWEKNRFIYDLMYVRKVMSRQLFDWLVKERVADGPLIAKWRKPGYEILCSLLAIQKSGHNFGGTSLCRVPMRRRTPQQRRTPDVQTGCICCASGDGLYGGPIWWNTVLPGEGGAEGEGGEGAAAREDNRATWQGEGDEREQRGVGGGLGVRGEGGGPGSSVSGHKRRAAERGADGAADDDDELEPDVKARLEALKRAA